MLEGRSYMRKDPMDSRVSVCTILIVTLAGVFLVQYMGGIRMFDFNEYLALSKDGLLHNRFWQFLTFQFLHSGPWPFHLLFNCLALYFFGREVEQALGPRDFLKLYLGSGLVGGLLEAALMFLPGPAASVHVLGASAGVAGVFTAYALLFPHQPMMLLVIPIRFRPVHMLWAFIIFSVVGAVLAHWPSALARGTPPIGNVAHAAHLGGIAAAFAYLRWGIRAESFVAQRRTRRSRFRPRELIKVPLGRNSAWQRSKAEVADLTPDEFISREVDPILDKISAHGMQSLTAREKQILESARSKIEGR